MKAAHAIAAVLLLFSFVNGYTQTSNSTTGFASFYHNYFNGKRTASGELLSQKKFTCAHRTFPFGTKLRVTNLENCKSAVVTVNDRGPFARGRIIDVTEAVAKKLGFFLEGQAKVEIEIISSDDKADSVYTTVDSLQPFYKIEAVDKDVSGYSVKVASFYIEAKALDVVRQLKQQYDCEIFIQPVNRKEGVLYRIFAGKFKIRNMAEKEQEKIQNSFSDCYVVELSAK